MWFRGGGAGGQRRPRQRRGEAALRFLSATGNGTMPHSAAANSTMGGTHHNNDDIDILGLNLSLSGTDTVPTNNNNNSANHQMDYSPDWPIRIFFGIVWVSIWLPCVCCVILGLRNCFLWWRFRNAVPRDNDDNDIDAEEERRNYINLLQQLRGRDHEEGSGTMVVHPLAAGRHSRIGLLTEQQRQSILEHVMPFEPFVPPEHVETEEESCTLQTCTNKQKNEEEERDKKEEDEVGVTVIQDVAEKIDANDESYCEPAANVCPICLDPFEVGTVVNATPPSSSCHHTFHKACLLLWLDKHDYCPMCRHPMVTDETWNAAVMAMMQHETQEEQQQQPPTSLPPPRTRRRPPPPPETTDSSASPPESSLSGAESTSQERIQQRPPGPNESSASPSDSSRREGTTRAVQQQQQQHDQGNGIAEPAPPEISDSVEVESGHSRTTPTNADAE